MEFRGYTDLTEEERAEALEYADRAGVPVSEVMRRMSGWGRTDLI